MKETISSVKIIKDPLIEPFHITMDQYCYTVMETITPDPKYTTNGKLYEKPIGHFSNFGNCLERIAKLRANSKSYESIKEFLIEYNRIVTELKQLTQI